MEIKIGQVYRVNIGFPVYERDERPSRHSRVTIVRMSVGDKIIIAEDEHWRSLPVIQILVLGKGGMQAYLYDIRNFCSLEPEVEINK